MKLDKIKFARLIAFINQWTLLNENDIRTIDDMIDIESKPQHFPDMVSEINILMSLMAGGQKKIEAIKSYRMLTGASLLDAKNMVEAHWRARSDATLGDILKQATGKD